LGGGKRARRVRASGVTDHAGLRQRRPAPRAPPRPVQAAPHHLGRSRTRPPCRGSSAAGREHVPGAGGYGRRGGEGDSVPGPHLLPMRTIVRLKPHGAFRRVGDRPSPPHYAHQPRPAPVAGRGCLVTAGARPTCLPGRGRSRSFSTSTRCRAHGRNLTICRSCWGCCQRSQADSQQGRAPPASSERTVSIGVAAPECGARPCAFRCLKRRASRLDQRTRRIRSMSIRKGTAAVFMRSR
jgi:hypothetical protein